MLFRHALALILSVCLAGPLHASGAGDLARRLENAFEAGALSGLHSVLVLRKGEVFAEVYFPGSDQRWGAPLGVRRHGPDTLHDLRSVTKSIVGLLYGIALAEGLVPDVDESLIAQFPRYQDLAADPARQKIEIGHALSMQMGTAWDESLPYTDPRNSEIAMERTDDRYRHALGQPVMGPPGQDWTYNGGATAIIARLIAERAGMPIDAYARKTLFEPLGITRFEWVAGADGEPSAASGLRLGIRDLARIGQMIAEGGTYRGKRIVPVDWLERSFTPRAALESGLRYGYFWWLAPDGDPPDWIAAIGNGGQRLTVRPQSGLVIAIFAGNYNQPDDWTLPVRVIEQFLLPALKAGLSGG